MVLRLLATSPESKSVGGRITRRTDELEHGTQNKVWLTFVPRGAYAVVDPHNFGRYYNNIISDTSGFQAWWGTVASRFATNDRVVFDTNNEYHDMDNALVGQLNQAAINGIRAAGANTQYIFVEGNSYSGAWTWVGDRFPPCRAGKKRIAKTMDKKPGRSPAARPPPSAR